MAINRETVARLVRTAVDETDTVLASKLQKLVNEELEKERLKFTIEHEAKEALVSALFAAACGDIVAYDRCEEHPGPGYNAAYFEIREKIEVKARSGRKITIDVS